MNTRTTVWKREKALYRKRLDVAMAIAILLMFCFFGFTKPMPIQRVTLPEAFIQIINTPPEIVIPKPPPEIDRPQVPVESFDESVEETIDDTDFDPNDTVTMPPPPPLPNDFPTFDRPPEPLRIVPPVYPDIARQLGLSGTVRCLVTIDRRGRVVDVVVYDSDSELFDASVVDALEQWTWEPAEQNGNPVRATVLVPFRFTVEH